MGIQSTVVFADLFGSTGVFESLGNAQATELVTEITTWLAGRFAINGGRVVKFLGDGVLVVFSDNRQAVTAVIDVQREFETRFLSPKNNTKMPLRIGVARGDVEMVGDDCYGDAVNIAARLSELTGPQQIWLNAEVVDGSHLAQEFHLRPLGPIQVRGRTEWCNVYQLEWQEDTDSQYFTIQSPLADGFVDSKRDALGSQIELTWLDNAKTFKSFELPIHIGRVRQAEFVVNDPRVSRQHARLDWRNGSIMLVDVSSYGCWIRFAGGGADVLLRREECVLHGKGEVALGTPFSDISAPVITFLVR
ncbi:MAG: adenylate/guanylate cyclase domain-containing protein [Betaproteobacteria bacterium]|nr:adenylate/guanylate cyclase domain-containing protein [Betaproteobacteria bacterium]NCP81349.1 adenylate/guanylate cyclase domain-containing protein [Rhodoferax sp.]NCS59901.1 adenylate/guanylate cyclase domain-containing protein [Rhodoferax sp.]OIP14850.1 MAG: adenylate/guanylate cyclase domain-containing protein [Comamonadaceae bacterium CG2_30_57_122]